MAIAFPQAIAAHQAAEEPPQSVCGRKVRYSLQMLGDVPKMAVGDADQRNGKSRATGPESENGGDRPTADDRFSDRLRRNPSTSHCIAKQLAFKQEADDLTAAVNTVDLQADAAGEDPR